MTPAGNPSVEAPRSWTAHPSREPAVYHSHRVSNRSGLVFACPHNKKPVHFISMHAEVLTTRAHIQQIP
jgi:hypothetical protein